MWPQYSPPHNHPPTYPPVESFCYCFGVSFVLARRHPINKFILARDIRVYYIKCDCGLVQLPRTENMYVRTRSLCVDVVVLIIFDQFETIAKTVSKIAHFIVISRTVVAYSDCDSLWVYVKSPRSSSVEHVCWSGGGANSWVVYLAVIRN